MEKMRKVLPSFVAAAMCTMPLDSAMAQAERLRFDTPTELNGVEFVCTGIGREVRDDPAWNEYALKVEVAGEQGQFLGNVEFEIQRNGEIVVELICGGPWMLAQLETGTYNVTASFEGVSRSGTVNIVANDQTRLVFQIPVAAGAVSPERTTSP